MQLQLATGAKPGSSNNEDLFGFRENTFWLLDGATSTDGPPLDRDAYWLVHQMDLALRELSNPEQDLVVLARAACAKVQGQWPSKSTRRPVAAMALWRIGTGMLEVVITGNVTLIVDVGQTTYEMTDRRIVPAHAGASDALTSALAAGLQFESPEFQQLRRDMKAKEAVALDVQQKTWLVSPAEHSVEDFVTFAGPFGEKDRVMAATDGFMELRRYLRHESLVQFRQYVEAVPLNRSMNTLRTCERHSESGKHFPRTKRHDDATVVLISNGAVR